MLTFSSENNKVSPQQNKRYSDRLVPYIKHLQEVAKSKKYLAPESSIVLPNDSHAIKQVQRLAQTMSSRSLKYVIVIGIGGSNLGAKAVYDALYGHTDAYMLDRSPKLICLDTCDSASLESVVEYLKKNITSEDEYIINVISKSGATTETAANMAYLFQASAKKLPKFNSRIVLTTDRGSALWELGKEKDYPTLEMPKQVGGRYSVFSAVGLFPLACLGIDIGKLCKGAQWSIKQGLSERTDSNSSAMSAIALVNYYSKGGRIHDTFFFAPALETVGKWYRQLFAESLGKVPSNSKTREAISITPTVSIGSTDLHSMAQLYLANPSSRFTTFVSVKNSAHSQRLEASDWTNLVQGLKGQTMFGLMSTIYRGVVNTYTSKKMPFITIEMKEYSEFVLGALMQMKMLEVMFCAHLLGVNAFDQPHVELYKKEVRKLLE